MMRIGGCGVPSFSFKSSTLHSSLFPSNNLKFSKKRWFGFNTTRVAFSNQETQTSNSHEANINEDDHAEEWEATIGLEVHAQITAKHKLVSDVLNYNTDQEKERFDNLKTFDQNFGPNSFVGFADGGLPGALPGISMECVANLCRTGHALGGEVQKFSQFDRKHYFYPDLPTGYQITQQFYPLVLGGKISITKEDYDYYNHYKTDDAPQKQVGERKRKRIEEQLLNEQKKKESRLHLQNETFGLKNAVKLYIPERLKHGEVKDIKITRIHLEHDSAKTVHDVNGTNIDFNRSGIGLMEIVSEPDMKSSEEAAIYLHKLQNILKFINTSSASMETGSMRCDVNISIKKRGDTKLGTRCEIKNLNSINNIQLAIDCEIRRHIALIENNQRVEQQTRGFDAQTHLTYLLREKESEVDYRYFPEPDLPPLILTDEFIAEVTADMPKLEDKFHEYQEQGIRPEICKLLVEMPELSNYFDAVINAKSFSKSALPPPRNVKMISHIVSGHLLSLLSRDVLSIQQCPISPLLLASVADVEAENLVSPYVGKQILEKIYKGDTRNAYEIIQDEAIMKGYLDEEKLFSIVKQTFYDKLEFVDDYLNTPEYKQERKIQSFIGSIMKQTKGSASPALVKSIFLSLLESFQEEKSQNGGEE